MPIPVPKPRHTVEKFDALVRVTLPSKRNIFHILFVCLWFAMWGYMVSGLLYVAITANKAIELGKNSTPPVQPGGVFVMVSICFSLFLLGLLGLGIFGLYRVGWLITGKEVIEATAQTLTITKQISRWKRSKEYASENVNDLRPNTQPLSTLFFPGKRVRKFLGGAGMIAFDYGARTFTFGQDIDEAEAKQIILVLKERLPPHNAG